ncbi:MAG: glycosyltransferase [Bacteroidetes bacterium 4572_128]|nr:MAG: glycosyltransferase [Bacteroidetes bacterium 4572_128]
MIKLSIVVTVFNEEENIKPLVKAIHLALKNIKFNYEIIYVDDGSSDKTVEKIKLLKDEKIKLIELRRNFGQSSALSAGIDLAKGEFIGTMDGDLQNDPSDFLPMLEKSEKENFDMVAGIRIKRKDKMIMRKIPSKIANFLIRNLTNVHLKDYGCAIRILRKEIAHKRQFGESKYGINRTFKVISDLILILFFKKYIQKPMHLFGNLGIFIFAIGILINIYLLILKIMGNDIWGKPILLVGMLFIFVGLQFITTGIISELMIRTYYESQNKKHYKIRKITNF